MGKKDFGYHGMSMKNAKIYEWTGHYGKYVLCVLGGAVFYLMAEVLGQDVNSVENGMLQRNACGQGEAGYELVVDGLEKPFHVYLSVPELELSEEAFRSAVPEIAELLMMRIVGENPSLQEVCTDLELMREIPEYGVDVSWQSDRPDVVADDGTVCAEDVTEVLLEARLSNGSISEILEIPIVVFPPKVSVEDRFRSVLEDVILQNKEQEDVVLPKEFEGNAIRYRSAESSSNEMLFFLGVVAAICLFLKEREDAVTARKKREEQLMEDYPDFVYEFLILSGAGYSAKAAWKKLANSYCADVRKKKRALCEEMQITMNQMETGVPEVRAYVEFGKRCGNRSYVKFASFLESSISTGGKNLRKLLETEVKEAFELRTDIARRKGEEASAKLLLPTFIMLSVVMVMVMAPAFLTML